MLWVYGAWIALEVGLVVAGKRKIRAFRAFAHSWQGRA
jgi:hypothetical protein